MQTGTRNRISFEKAANHLVLCEGAVMERYQMKT
jgi:hypothetical protein